MAITPPEAPGLDRLPSSTDEQLSTFDKLLPYLILGQGITGAMSALTKRPIQGPMEYAPLIQQRDERAQRQAAMGRLKKTLPPEVYTALEAGYPQMLSQYSDQKYESERPQNTAGGLYVGGKIVPGTEPSPYMSAGPGRVFDRSTKQFITDPSMAAGKPRKLRFVNNVRSGNQILSGVFDDEAGTFSPVTHAPNTAMPSYVQEGDQVYQVVPGQGGPQASGLSPSDEVLVASLERSSGLQPGEYRSVIGAESNYDPTAISPKGAAGWGQLMPDTARGVADQIGQGKVFAGKSDDEVRSFLRDKDNRYFNGLLGATYYKNLLTRYKGNRTAALVAYNWGPANADKWLAEGADPSKLPEETQGYLARVQQQPQQLPGKPLWRPEQPKADKAAETAKKDAEAAQATGQSVSMLDKAISIVETVPGTTGMLGTARGAAESARGQWADFTAMVTGKEPPTNLPQPVADLRNAVQHVRNRLLPQLLGEKGRISDKDRELVNQLVANDSLWDHPTKASRSLKMVRNIVQGKDPYDGLEQASQQASPQGGLSPAMVQTKEDYEKLPSGTVFTAPDGSRRVKP